MRHLDPAWLLVAALTVTVINLAAHAARLGASHERQRLTAKRRTHRRQT